MDAGAHSQYRLGKIRDCLFKVVLNKEHLQTRLTSKSLLCIALLKQDCFGKFLIVSLLLSCRDVLVKIDVCAKIYIEQNRGKLLDLFYIGLFVMVLTIPFG